MCGGGDVSGAGGLALLQFFPQALLDLAGKKDREAFWLLETKTQQRNMYFVIQN